MAGTGVAEVAVTGALTLKQEALCMLQLYALQYDIVVKRT